MAGANPETRGSRTGFEFWGSAVVATLSMFLGVLDSSMMNVAVPVIVKDLNTTVSAMQAAIAVYSMVMAALIIPGGTLRAAIDTKRLLIVTLAIYSVGTLMAGLSQSFSTLFLGWSLIEGVAAALLLPITYSIIVENYEGSTAPRPGHRGRDGGRRRRRPMIGGTLTTYASWRWGFIGEFLVVLVIVALTLRYLTAKPSDESLAFDAGGTALSILGIVGIIGGSLLAGNYGWIRPLRPFVVNGTQIQPLGLSPAIWCIGLGLAFLVAFVRWEIRQERADRPVLIPPSVLRNRTFAAGTSTFASESLSLSGFMFTVPVSPVGARVLGVRRRCRAVAVLAGDTRAGGDIDRLAGVLRPETHRRRGSRAHRNGMLVLIGRIGLDLTISGMILPMLIVGVGLGLFTGQLVDLTMSAVPKSESGVSSGVINSVSQLGYAFGTAVAGSVLLSQFYGGIVDGVAQATTDSEVSDDERRELLVTLQDGVDTTTQAQQEAFVDQLPVEAQDQLLEIVRTAMETAQRSVLVLIVLFVLLTLLAASFLPRSQRR